jgi:hypothetical protein
MVLLFYVRSTVRSHQLILLLKVLFEKKCTHLLLFQLLCWRNAYKEKRESYLVLFIIDKKDKRTVLNNIYSLVFVQIIKHIRFEKVLGSDVEQSRKRLTFSCLMQNDHIDYRF